MLASPTQLHQQPTRKTMLTYHPKLRTTARILRRDMTDAERHLWYHLRRKQLLNIQFYRQKPIGFYVVDFYAPAAKLIVEIDGSQHFEEQQKNYDEKRTLFLESQGLKVLRFNNFDVLTATDNVLTAIYQSLKERLFV